MSCPEAETTQPAEQQSYAITLDQEQLNAVLNGLHNERVDTDRYLFGYPENTAPKKTDSCCQAHYLNFLDKIQQRESLLKRKELIERTITLLEDHEVRPEP